MARCIDKKEQIEILLNNIDGIIQYLPNEQVEMLRKILNNRIDDELLLRDFLEDNEIMIIKKDN